MDPRRRGHDPRKNDWSAPPRQRSIVKERWPLAPEAATLRDKNHRPISRVAILPTARPTNQSTLPAQRFRPSEKGPAFKAPGRRPVGHASTRQTRYGGRHASGGAMRQTRGDALVRGFDDMTSRQRAETLHSPEYRRAKRATKSEKRSHQRDAPNARRIFARPLVGRA